MQFLSSLPRRAIRSASGVVMGLGLAFAPALAGAQSLFSPAITVNETRSPITSWSSESCSCSCCACQMQPQGARDALIEEMLKENAYRAVGIEVGIPEIEEAMTQFAGRVELELDQFLQVLLENGVEPQTFRAFVENSLGWRELIRGLFLAQARPTDAEVDAAMAADGGAGGVRVLLSEIIIPLTPQTADQVAAVADRVSQLTDQAAFSDEARRFSAASTAADGGRLEWMLITNLPAALRPQILALSPGEVTAPIQIPNAVALFQLRGIQEAPSAAPRFSAIEYAAYYIPGGRSEAALQEAARVRAQVDSCDDLYGVAFGQPEEVLERGSRAPGEIPSDIAFELSKLDPGEVSTALTRSNGQTLVFLMLCGRTASINEEASREEVGNALIQQRLNAFSVSYLDQLRAEALIIEK